jgi:hypothetical protein
MKKNYLKHIIFMGKKLNVIQVIFLSENISMDLLKNSLKLDDEIKI